MYQKYGGFLLSYSEFTIDKLFKVVKITDHDGISKEGFATQGRVCNKVVKVVNLFEGASVLIIPVEYVDGSLLRVKDCKAVSTSCVESISLTNTMGLPVRLVIETLNTIYYLDEVPSEQIKRRDDFD